MKPGIDVSVSDYAKARESARGVQVGSYFVFDDGSASSGGRLARLLARPEQRRAVLPLVDRPVELPGLAIKPTRRAVEAIAALVSDRDLYRAEQDVAYLFAAVPGTPPPDLAVVLSMNGAFLTERKLRPGPGGMAIEPFSALLAGEYTARLQAAGRNLGQPVSFTVAEYTLAPLSARLASHRLDRASRELHFVLAVESYQVPFDRELVVALVEGRREVAHTRLEASAPGAYAGRLPLGGGDGALRLRLTAADDPGRMAEVAIPGSRKAERETTVVSELGREVLLSLMPDAGALPIRGGWLSQGDYISSPLVVEKVDAVPGVIRAQADLESLVFAVLDLSSGSFRIAKHGDVAAGTEIRIESESPVFTVFAGCWVGGAPFEGYTTFFRPVAMRLALQVPETAAPRSELPVRLSCPGASGEVQVLLSVRDRRLTATDTPGLALAASVKRGIDAAVEGMKEAAIEPLDKLVRDPWMMSMGAGPALRMGGGLRMLSRPGAVARPPVAQARLTLGDGTAAADTMMGVAEALEQPAGRTEALALSEKPAIHEPRDTFAEVLFFGLVPVSGEETVRIPLADSLGTFSVEAFSLAGGDWVEARASFAVDQPVRADLDLPPAVHPGDAVRGRMRASARSGRVRIALTRDGTPVELPAGDLASPAELDFALLPGLHRATVTDVATGETDVAEVEVGTPGKLRSLVRELRLLRAGESTTLDAAGALSLRILPGLEEKMSELIEATADYGHLCCEQTAAKILAATLMWLTAGGPARRSKAEGVILAGIGRERRMWRRGKGFSMYPELGDVHDHYSPLVVRHLWSLDALAGAPGVPPALREALAEGTAMADDVAKAFRLKRVPDRIATIEDAYALALSGGPRAADRARDYVETAIEFPGGEPRARSAAGAVDQRALLAYGSAVLLAAGDLARGVRAANAVTRQLNAQGRLYSTVDSVAAIAMMTALMRAGVASGAGRVKANGTEMDAAGAVRLADQVESVEVLEGCVPVEVTRIHEEDWSRYAGAFPIKVGFRGEGGGKVSRFRMGDRVELNVELPQGYKAGDLLHVALPAAMSLIAGGARVKRFSLDFEGRSEMSVPLVVTSGLQGRQRFAVCVRNMFEEERAASPGLLEVG